MGFMVLDSPFLTVREIEATSSNHSSLMWMRLWVTWGSEKEASGETCWGGENR